MATRQPIVSVLGHVDHGKTSILDKVRGSTVATREAGAITQHIGASEMPLDAIREVCGPLMEGKEFKVPGLLFIDTPGHHAFSTLRARGGALADIAILVVDINEGFMPQTKEALTILRRNRTPFVVAANKLDLVPGWDTSETGLFTTNARKQAEKTKDRLDERVYDLIGAMTEMGVPSADRIDRIKDFTQSVAVVPVSAQTGEGVPELLMTLVGLAQRFLEKSLVTNLEATGRGTVLEVKEERGMGLTLDAIVYDGNVRVGDHLVIGALGEPKLTKVKGLYKPRPKDEMRDSRETFASVKEVAAASGVKISAQDLEGVLAGAPLLVVRDEDQLDEALEEVRAERLNVTLDDDGVYVKADTLGSLEALASELKDRKIPIKRADVGDISKRDLIEANTIAKPEFKAILAFNVKLLPDAKDALGSHDFEEITVLADDVIYTIMDAYEEWADKKKAAMEADLREEMTFPGKVLLMGDHVFRQSKPAIVGMRVLAGRLRVGQRFLREDGRVIGKVKSIRRGEESVKEARPGDEVAVAIDDVIIGRHMEEGAVYYVDLPQDHARKFGRNPSLLNQDEREVLNEVMGVKRKEERFWAA